MISQEEILEGKRLIQDSEFGDAVDSDIIDSYTDMMELRDLLEKAGYWMTITGSFITGGRKGEITPLVRINPHDVNTNQEALFKALVGLVNIHTKRHYVQA